MTLIGAFDVGRHVECDTCGQNLTDDPRSGGFIFSNKGVGPCCAERVMASVERYGEQRYLDGTCPPGTSFADWIRLRRAQTPGGNQVQIFSGLPDEVMRGPGGAS